MILTIGSSILTGSLRSVQAVVEGCGSGQAVDVPSNPHSSTAIRSLRECLLRMLAEIIT
jgi:ascorbate-specific PTS system EIIC-type component UlaA